MSHPILNDNKSTEIPIFLRESQDLRFDLEALKSWREEFKKRFHKVVVYSRISQCFSK